MERHLLGFAILFASVAAARAADNWADSAGTDYAASKAICSKAKGVKLPVGSDSAPNACDSTRLLYGIGRTADAAAARACAARELKNNGDDSTGGAATLATIYANGSGVGRDYDVAIAYACLINGAPAEIDGRVKHLAELRAHGPGKAAFDVCDDATSGLMEGFCAGRDGALADAKRDVEIARLTAHLEGAAKAAFAKLRGAEQAFVEAAAENEVDTGGTARGAMIVGSRQAHRDAFAATIRKVLDGTLAATGTARAADAALNAAYNKVMGLKDTSGLGTVEKKGVKATQLRWLAYRDAFVAFAGSAVPTASSDALTTELTKARTDDLLTLGDS